MFGVLDRYPGVELLGHMLVLLFVFGVFFFVFVFVFFRTSILFTTVAVTIYFKKINTVLGKPKI